MIKRIERDTIRPLAAAQVILDLASAIKELVENSIDAHASQISKKKKKRRDAVVYWEMVKRVEGQDTANLNPNSNPSSLYLLFTANNNNVLSPACSHHLC